MFVKRNGWILAAGIALTGMAFAQSAPVTAAPAGPAGSTAQGGLQAPGQAAAGVSGAVQAPASAGSTPNILRPSDTIGEVADRQRMNRMLQSQSKLAVAASTAPVVGGSGAAPLVGAISVERMPQQALQQANAKPAVPEMALVEILRGPKAIIVAIDVNGVERRVVQGEDLGNGWKVKSVGRFTVELEEVVVEVTESKKAASGKGKPKSAIAKKAPKTQTLALRTQAFGLESLRALDPQRALAR